MVIIPPVLRSTRQPSQRSSGGIARHRLRYWPGPRPSSISPCSAARSSGFWAVSAPFSDGPPAHDHLGDVLAILEILPALPAHGGPWDANRGAHRIAPRSFTLPISTRCGSGCHSDSGRLSSGSSMSWSVGSRPSPWRTQPALPRLAEPKRSTTYVAETPARIHRRRQSTTAGSQPLAMARRETVFRATGCSLSGILRLAVDQATRAPDRCRNGVRPMTCAA